ncbi:MAG: adenylate/guanylate cyclase domain-containing protein [Bacteroidota bacterium]
MTGTFKNFFFFLIRSIVFWVIACCFFIIIRQYAINELENIREDSPFYIPVTQWLHFGVLVGLAIGVIYATGEWTFEKYITPKLNLGISIVIKTISYLLVLIIILSILTFRIEKYLDVDLSNDRGWWRTSKIFWLTVVYFWVCSMVFALMKIASERFGRGMFFNILIGKYRKPQEVNKLFMFLDLKSSTSIAEAIGHFKYSQMIQDCFYDLNSLIDKYDADIYQYVGDEAVLTWDYNSGTKKNRCISLFFAFKKRLKQRSEYYLKTYGHQPEFKAGLHGGKLMVAEIGAVKKDLAFHGDVINTASRIQSLCSTYDKELLISEPVLSKLSISETHYELLSEDVELRGKDERLKIYAIDNRTVKNKV